MGTLIVFQKELADHLSSKRFYILFFIIYTIGLSLAYESIGSIRQELQRTAGESVFLNLFTIQAGVVPSFLGIVTFFGPLIGFILTFDALNREISSGTLGNVLSQPVHRDSVINGKFLAGITTMFLTLSGVILLVTGMGMIILGVPPSIEEVLRMCAFLAVSTVYLSVWVALGLLFTVTFRREGTSALASMATWLFFSIFIYMVADMATGAGVSPWAIMNLSPAFLYTQAASVVLFPKLRILGPVSYEKVIGMIPNPLSFDQSLLLVWPHLTSLTAAVFLIFIISYVRFMRQEIRAS